MVEVGESLEVVARRLMQEGNTVEQTAEMMNLPSNISKSAGKVWNRLCSVISRNM